MSEIEHEVCVKRKNVIVIVNDATESTQYLKYTKDCKYTVFDKLTPAEVVYNYYFVEDIEAATKTYSISVALDIIKMYRCDTGDTSTDLVVLPLQIRYSLIEERDE